MAKETKVLLKKIKKLKRRLKNLEHENDQAQAEIMGIALSGLKAAEINAQIIRELAVSGNEVTPSKVKAYYAKAAHDAKAKFDEAEQGSIEHSAMMLMAQQLFKLASLVGQDGDNNNGSSDEQSNQPEN